MSQNGQLANFHSLGDLQGLALAELESLWDAVPGEDQDYIQRRYAQAIHNKQVRDDASELQLIEAYLQRYEYEGLIPAGDKWLKISPAARQDFHLNPLQVETDEGDKERGRSPIVMLLIVAFAIFIVIILGSRLLAGGSNTEIEVSPTATATSTFTPTPTLIPTATALALVDTDRFVDESDPRSNRDYFPVVFRVIPGSDMARVFVVQERLVNTSEWNYEANPDVASWISGMFIRPVIGIPFNEDNQSLFASLDEGAEFILRMNTGAELRFQFDELINIPRDDSAIFSQQTAGIAVLLIGQIDEDGLPTSSRQVALGHYLVAQELDLLEKSYSGLPVPQGEIGAISDDLDLIVSDTKVSHESEDLDLVSLSLQLRTKDKAVDLSNFIWLVEDDNGNQYNPLVSSAPALSASGLPLHLAAGESVQAELRFRVPANSRALHLRVTSLEGKTSIFNLDLASVLEQISASVLDVQIIRITRDLMSITVQARLFNPSDKAVSVTQEQVRLVSGFVPDPIGPARAAFTFEDLTLQAGEAVDVSWSFNWNGSDPYAALDILGRHYRVNLDQN